MDSFGGGVLMYVYIGEIFKNNVRSPGSDPKKSESSMKSHIGGVSVETSNLDNRKDMHV
jgi:hypothetical protein